MTRREKWAKELFGLPTYLLGTLALLKISGGNNLLIVLVGLIPFVVAYNLIYRFTFQDNFFKKQWAKGLLLVGGQVLFWLLVFVFLLR